MKEARVGLVSGDKFIIKDDDIDDLLHQIKVGVISIEMSGVLKEHKDGTRTHYDAVVFMAQNIEIITIG